MSQGNVFLDEDLNNDVFRFMVTQCNTNISPYNNAIIMRLCNDCHDDYKILYYVRKTPIPASMDLKIYLSSYWRDLNNVLHNDFEIYNDFNDLIFDTNKWNHCNYNDVGVGFPRDCGRNGLKTCQWNAFRDTFGYPPSSCERKETAYFVLINDCFLNNIPINDNIFIFKYGAGIQTINDIEIIKSGIYGFDGEIIINSIITPPSIYFNTPTSNGRTPNAVIAKLVVEFEYAILGPINTNNLPSLYIVLNYLNQDYHSTIYTTDLAVIDGKGSYLTSHKFTDLQRITTFIGLNKNNNYKISLKIVNTVDNIVYFKYDSFKIYYEYILSDIFEMN